MPLPAGNFSSQSHPCGALPSGYAVPKVEGSGVLRGYRCAACRIVTHLADLNDDMLCGACGEPEEDPDNCEPTALELWRAERTWSV